VSGASLEVTGAHTSSRKHEQDGDGEDKINAFLPVLDIMMASGLVTLEKVQVLQYLTYTYIHTFKVSSPTKTGA